MKTGNSVGRGIFVFVLFFFGSMGAKAQLYVEDFLGEANGAQTGTAAGTPGGTWSTTATSVHRENVAIAGEILLAENTGTEQRWETNNINISTAGYAVISADVWSAFVDASDYLRLYYKVDGGPEILFYELNGGNNGADFEPATPASAIVSGNTLQVIARIRNNTTTIIIFPVPSLYGLDNVTVTRADVLYSRKTGTWTDMTGGLGGTGTWSINRSGTPACGCVPLNNVVAVIQNGHTVTLPVSQIAVGGAATPNLAPGAVDVESGGILQYNISGVTLGIQQGLMRVRSGGNVNSSTGAITGEQVSFNADLGGATLQVDAGGSMTVEDLVLGTNATNLHYLSGGGTLTITDDILIEANGATLTNNRSASFTVTDDLTFNSINSAFTNNTTVSIGDIVATDDDNVVTNSSGATLVLGGVNANDADLDVLNSGTINQSGNFSNISNADTNFDNLATGTWNWTLTPNATYDTDMNTVLNCTAVGNTFYYSGAGNQSIISTTYYHLVLQSSGTKLASAALDVNGNLTLSSTAVLSSGANAIDVEGNIDIQNTAVFGNGTSTGTINIGGNWSAVNAASFVEGSRIVTLDGAGAQTIANSSGTETFGALTLSGGGTKSSSNIIDVNGNVSIAGTAQFSVSNDISVSGNWAVTSTNGNPFVEGTYTVTLDGGAQAISTVLAGGETFNNLSLTGTGIVSNNSILDINGNLSIAGSAQLNANTDISLAGNWDVTSSNGDPFDQGVAAELVTFDGSLDQTITHTGGEIFNRVAVAKPGGSLILSTSITISNGTGTDLTLTQGKIISTSTNLIIVADDAISNGGDADSYVDGPIRKVGNDNFTFPTGNGNYWARISITPSGANTTTTFTAQYFASAAPNTTSLSGVARVSKIEYWQLTRSGTLTTNNNVVTLYWESGTRSKITDITPASNLFVARFDGTNWVTAGPGSLGGGSTVATGNVLSANITAANINTVTRNYTFGTNIALPDNPLPIELLAFSAQLKNDEVELKWSTASETNNDHFTIERATDVEHFEPIHTKDGKGTSKDLNHYSIVDSSPLYGRSYYRLKQTDFDGKFTYSDVRTIDYDGPAFATLTAFPNPLNSPILTLKIEGLKDATNVPVQILNLQGQKVFEKVIEIKTPGIVTEEISRTIFPSSGLYFIKAGETLYLTKKIVIE